MLENKKRSFFFALLALFIICETFLIQINPAVFDKSVSTIMTERKWWPGDWHRSIFGGNENEKEDDDDKGERGYDHFADMDYEAEARLRTFNLYDADYPARAARFDARRDSLRKR